MKKFVTILLFVAAIFMVLPLQTADAGAVGSSGSGGGSSGGGGGGGYFRTPLKWVIVRDAPKSTLMDSHTRIRPKPTHEIEAGSDIAYVTTQTYRIGGKDIKFPNNWYRWESWMVEGLGDPGSSSNKLLWSESHLLPKEFIEEAKNSGFTSEVKKGALYKGGGEYADAIWLQEIPVIKSSKNSKHVITAVEYSANSSKNFNNNSKSAKWLYENPQTSRTFSYNSRDKEYNFNHTIKVTTMTVTKHTTWEEFSNGKKQNVRTTYSTSNKKTKTVRASWMADIPTLSYKPFKPLDLSTKEPAKRSVLEKSEHYMWNDFRSKAIIADINNNKGSGEDKNAPMRVLDTNEVKPFSVKFNNNQFGIPTESQGGINVRASKPGFSSSLDRVQIYWDAKIDLAASTKSTNPQVVSLEYDGTEYKGREKITKGRGWRGGDFGYRSIKQGNYYLSDGTTNPFWTVSMMTGKYFKYGAKYTTTVTATASGPSFTNLSGSNIKVTNTNKWVGFVDKRIKQPILYGEFESKTVGGHRR